MRLAGRQEPGHTGPYSSKKVDLYFILRRGSLLFMCHGLLGQPANAYGPLLTKYFKMSNKTKTNTTFRNMKDHR